MTDLCKIMERFGSDKGGTNNPWHNYTEFYHEIFAPIRLNHLNIFELGLGTNNVNIPSNMGRDGKPGASLYGWREYFPNAQVYGADIDKDILFTSERIKTFYCDQLNVNKIYEMWSKIPEQFDIIIEDGLHTPAANAIFFENSIHKLKPNGIYIIEDIEINKIVFMEEYIKKWENCYPNCTFNIKILPSVRNTHDNVLLVVTKRP